MKKILVVLAALTLSFSPLFSQEADDAGTGVEFTIIPRIDLSPEFYDDGSGEFTLGNTTLYSLFDGSISENLVFSVANRWATFYSMDPLFDDTKALYEDSFKRGGNWLDWANLTWYTGDFSITFGKESMTTGGFEVDAYDFDMHSNMCSSIWNNLPVYQWGVKFGYNLSDDQVLTLQVNTSPFVEKLFDKAWMNYSLGWRGYLSSIETIWSASAIQTASDKFFYLVSLGNSVELGNFTVGLDVNNASMQTGTLEYGLSVIPSVTMGMNNNLQAFARGGYEMCSANDVDYDTWFVGGGVYWTPIEDLRVHATAAYNKAWGGVASLTLGATYYLRLLK